MAIQFPSNNSSLESFYVGFSETKDTKSDIFTALSSQEASEFFEKMDQKRINEKFPFFYKLGTFRISQEFDSLIFENQATS